MAHREDIKEFLRGLLPFDNCSIVDWGCGTKPITRYCKLGDNVTYLGIDKNKEVKPGLVADINSFFLLNIQYDFAFCMEVLEHVEHPEYLIRNVYTNLKSGGKFFLSVPFLFAKHSDEDYWRFTDAGIKLLLERGGFKIISLKSSAGDQGWLVTAQKL